MTSGHQYGNAHVVAPPPNTVPASTSLNTLGGDDTVTAKRAKAKHGKGKVAHGNQRTGTILNADVKTWINQSETMSSNLERGARGRRGGPRWPGPSAAHPARVAG